MNFQQGFSTDETFKTTSAQSYSEMGARNEPFALRQNKLTADQAALEEYREKYTKSNHNFKRTYLGAAQWKKSNQDWVNRKINIIIYTSKNKLWFDTDQYHIHFNST